ncbi:MAG: Asp-tRNA(Asn)/Glu-tRNA(Gln) amidotransferase subunit GatA [Puniceicoccaceae bacterium]
MGNLDQSGIFELGQALDAGRLEATALVETLLGKIDAMDRGIGAFLSVDRDAAMAAARESDGRRQGGQAIGPLDGIPVALKDNLALKGAPLTCASKMLANYVSPYDAHVVTCLKAAGAILLGRCNLDEFAMGSSTENSSRGPTRNPWNRDRVPGGSSGGSAAAVAAGFVPLALGSDTGGSIRQPAALCGVVGMKPTYGLISRYGLVAFASSLDQIGPFARSVRDAAALLEAVVGHDGRDSTSLQRPKTSYVENLGKVDLKGVRLGIPGEFFGKGLADDVRGCVEAALKFYESEGATLCTVSLPHSDLAVPVYYLLATAEASSNLARFDGIRYGHRAEECADGVDLYYRSRGEGFGPEVKRRILLGTYVLSTGYYDAYYLRAQKVRRLIRRDFEEVFRSVDFVVTPTAPTTAFPFGAKSSDPLAMYLSDVYTISANLAGLPALSLPCGFGGDQMPVGLQLLGPDFSESRLLAVAEAYESAHSWKGQVAPIATGGEG